MADKRKTYYHIQVRADTYDLIMGECIAAFLRDNPAYARLRLTHDFMARRIALYYLGRIDMFGKEKLEGLQQHELEARGL